MSYTGRSANGESQTITQNQTQDEQIGLVFTTSVPTIVIDSIRSVQSLSALVACNLIDDGGCNVTAKGVCYSTTNPNPDINDPHTNSAGGSTFNAVLTLSQNTFYYIRAYATNVNGTAYSSSLSLMTTPFLPFVNTNNVSNITYNSARCGGSCYDFATTQPPIIERGVCWCTHSHPTVYDAHTSDGEGEGTFSSNMTGLSGATTYYVRAYASTSEGTSYGEEFSFITSPFDDIGASSALFSVSSTKRVRFSKGNLQYKASTETWRFAESQTDYIGSNNSNISSFYSDWIDLFGFGTSGWNSNAPAYQPWSTSSTATDYYPVGSTSTQLYGTYANADWGVYNAISNGGNQAGLWRTMQKYEWAYLLNTRDVDYRYAMAKIENVCGMIIFPDNFRLPEGITVNDANSAVAYTTNTYSSSQWYTLQKVGCIFLPAAGMRYGSTMTGVGSSGCYWTASGASYADFGENHRKYAYNINFSDGQINVSGIGLMVGSSVRLVRDEFANNEVIPTVQTSEASSIHSTSFVCGGNVTNAGNSTVIERGICWGTSDHPTIDGNHQAASSTGTGAFSLTISGLNTNTVYCARAYAINNVGIAYGNTVYLLTSQPSNTGGFDENGASNSLFSVSDTRRVRFSKSNLQCDVMYDNVRFYYWWQFSDNQYDYIGTHNSDIALMGHSTNSYTIDLFGWGTSGHRVSQDSFYYGSPESYQYSNSRPYYGPNADLTGHFSDCDWGWSNSIHDGGYKTGLWRTMSSDEWSYLIYDRSEDYRFAKAKVNGVNGLLIFPDNFSLPSGITLQYVNDGSVYFYANTYTLEQWNTLENAGVIFLPAASRREGSAVVDTDFLTGFYWTSTARGAASAKCMSFTNLDVTIADNPRYTGQSVRLVMDEKPFDANGASNAVFSVSDTKNVRFSMGNLRYNAAINEWSFADEQYHYVGEGNRNISQTYDGPIDLFGWGTSGWNSGATAYYHPWDTSKICGQYGPAVDLTGSYANADWGVYNAIFNGGNQPGMWRTMSKDEWLYLLFNRSDYYRFAMTKINGVNGLLIFPDGFSLPYGFSVQENAYVDYTTNSYSLVEWQRLQSLGCVFLPTAGERRPGSERELYEEGWNARYWSSSYANPLAWSIHFNYWYIETYDICPNQGYSVRLVQNVE